MTVKTLEIALEVAYVGQGGNTGGGKYFYSYLPEIVVATEAPTQVLIGFSSATGPEFVMNDLIASDGGSQLSPAVIAPDGRSLQISNANTVKQLIIMDVLVQDTSRSKTVICDPQILNRPD